MNVILYAIPIFFLLIAIELIAEKTKGTNYYRVNDAVTSLSIGVFSRVTGVLKALFPFTIFVVIHENFRFFDIPSNGWIFVLFFIIYDFLYYWNHRFGHEISLFWAAHVVHHSSEDYNLTTALRQTSGSFFNFIFFVPLALLGLDPVMLATIASVNLVYQFWVHTQHIPKLGWLEHILITPSNHRVHHAQNQIYLDKNYGGVFIVWDRLFGTFQEELDSEPCVYGVRKALHSWNPIFANIQVYKQLLFDSFHARSWTDKFKVWFGKTGWRPTDVEAKFPLEKTDLTKFVRYHTELTLFEKCYAIFQYIFVTALALFLLLNVQHLDVSKQVSICALVIFGAIALALYLDKHALRHAMQFGFITALFITAIWLHAQQTVFANATILYAFFNTTFAVLVYRRTAAPPKILGPAPKSN